MAEVKLLTASSALRVVPLADLKVDNSYQRAVVNRHKQIVANFDPSALGIPLVGQREDGSLWIVDGLQRITALRKLNKTTVRAEVFVSRGPEHEAEVFKLVNAGRTKLTARDLFKAKLTSGDTTAWAIKHAVEAAGFKLDTSRPTNKVTETAWEYVIAYNTLESIFKSDETKGGRITRILNLVKAAWPGDMRATNSDILGGLGSFYAQRTDIVDDEKLARNLATTTPEKVLYSGSLGVGGRHANIADVISKIYTKRVKKAK